MKTINDGGPAFPSLKITSGSNADHILTAVWSETVDGMSLRDWFAGMSLQGIKGNIELCKICADVDGLTQAQAIARMAYVDADAMLAESDKHE